MAADKTSVRVQVCYATPEARFLKDVSLAAGSTLEQAIHLSGLLALAPEIDLASCKTGIYGKIKPLDTVVRERDRVEIYRPLMADPKDARRRRVTKKEKAR